MNKKEGADSRQVTRSKRTPCVGIAASIAPQEYERITGHAAWIIGICFGVMFAIGIAG